MSSFQTGEQQNSQLVHLHGLASRPEQSKTIGQFFRVNYNVFKLVLYDFVLICCIFNGLGVDGAVEEDDDDDVPDLVENFDEASKGEDVVKSEGKRKFFYLV